MPLPPQLKQRILNRFDGLIKQGEPLAALSRKNRLDISDGVIEWGTKCASLLMQILPQNHPRRKELPNFGSGFGSAVNPPSHLAILKAIRDDFDAGIFDDLGMQIEAEIAYDYMGQADGLLNNGQSGKYDHVPAAVLSGAVLEKSLRTLCSNRSPPIPVVTCDGKPLTMNPIVTALKKANVFNQTMAAQLEAWAQIRNKAAHGEFDQFTRQQVEAMILGIKNFLATYLN